VYKDGSAGYFCRLHAESARLDLDRLRLDTYEKTDSWVQKGLMLQKDPCAMGYMSHMLGGVSQQMLCGQPQQPQYYQPGQLMQRQMPQQQMVTYGGGACGPMAGPMVTYGGGGACGPMMGGFAASAPIPIPGAGYLPVATAMPAHMQQHGVPVAFRWQ
jgi:hypothetical protein